MPTAILTVTLRLLIGRMAGGRWYLPLLLLIFNFDRDLVLGLARLCLCLWLVYVRVRLLLMMLHEIVLLLLGVGCGLLLLLLLLLLHVMGKLCSEVDHGSERMGCCLLRVAEGRRLGHEQCRCTLW